MKLTKVMKGALAAASIALVGSFAQAQQAGGSLVFLVQPEPPTMAGYVSTSGPIGLLGPKIYCLLYTSPSPRDQRGSRMAASG